MSAHESQHLRVSMQAPAMPIHWTPIPWPKVAAQMRWQDANRHPHCGQPCCQCSNPVWWLLVESQTRRCEIPPLSSLWPHVQKQQSTTAWVSVTPTAHSSCGSVCMASTWGLGGVFLIATLTWYALCSHISLQQFVTLPHHSFFFYVAHVTNTKHMLRNLNMFIALLSVYNPDLLAIREVFWLECVPAHRNPHLTKPWRLSELHEE